MLNQAAVFFSVLACIENLHHIQPNRVSVAFFFCPILNLLCCVFVFFFFALELSSRFDDHTIFISIQLTTRTKSFLIDLNIRVNWNHLILFELSVSLLASKCIQLSRSTRCFFRFYFIIFYFLFLFVCVDLIWFWFVVLEMAISLAWNFAELWWYDTRFVYRHLVRSINHGQPPVFAVV